MTKVQPDSKLQSANFTEDKLHVALSGHRLSTINLWIAENRQICKPPGAFGDNAVWVVDLRGRVPKDVKFKIVRCPAMGVFKRRCPLRHDASRIRQGNTGIKRIAARPQSRADLITRNFACASDCMVIVAALQHGQRRPAIHRQRVGGQD